MGREPRLKFLSQNNKSDIASTEPRVYRLAINSMEVLDVVKAVLFSMLKIRPGVLVVAYLAWVRHLSVVSDRGTL
ncbi:hypothetical protein [Crateriforma spongiae]|uniref:hypothetical protein n=1 Tax=Crateriforma spongiae TaxID=2724528 RepID=UPI0039AF2AA3